MLRDELFEESLEQLRSLVRIPSVSADPTRAGEVRAAAEAIAQLYDGAGMETRLLEVEGAHPAVLATIPPPKGAPTVLLYAHHDVQPTGPLDEWVSPPFEPTERDGRLYGRGTVDDKWGAIAHLTAVRAFNGEPPVGVTILVEGEEEIGSPNLGRFLSEYGDHLRADAVVLADSSNWELGTPSITTSLRGLVEAYVEVRTIETALHSGMYGGPVPDALSALCRLLASLQDDSGTPTVGERVAFEGSGPQMSEASLRRDAGMLEGVQLTGAGSISGRLWTRPSINVVGIDAPSVADAINQLIPVARAKISMRIAPGDDKAVAYEELKAHLLQNVPWGARIEVTPGSGGDAFQLDPSSRFHEAMRSAMRESWKTEPVDIGVGGSIPFVAAFADAFPQAALLLTGCVDPAAKLHSTNESLDLGEFRRAIEAEIGFLAAIAN